MSDNNPSIEDLLEKDGKAAQSKAQAPVQSDQAQTKTQDKGDEDKQQELTQKIGQIGQAGVEKEVEAKAKQLNLGYVDFEKTLIDRQALPLLKQKEMQELKAVVFLNKDSQLRIGTTEPSDKVSQKLNDLAKENHAQGGLYLISEQSLQKALKEFDKIPKKTKPTKAVAISAKDLEKYKQDANDPSKLPEKIKTIPLTDVMNIILASGIKAQASDIHIEAEEKGIQLRFRLDGVLHDVAEIPKDKYKEIISRIKLVSKIKLNIEDKPQDGHIDIEMPDEKLDIRVSTLPTEYGESVVMRILRSSSIGLKFEDLGIRGKSFNDLKREIERPNGMILTTGPTGSGKTTTMYAALSKLNKEDAKIITLEDPIEYKLKGINQSQIDKEKDYDFAKGLKHILRQDPDVVMVGEIRDIETADVAINAALTGHLVLSTLHTNDAAGAIPRFLGMGVKPFLLAPSINAVIGQRLVRRICERCKQEAELTSDILPRVMKILETIPKNSGYAVDAKTALKFYSAKACDKCRDGYKGRIGIYEVFTMTPEIEKMVLAGQISDTDVKKITQEAGMISMVQDGILKAMDGITTVEEIFRVTEE